MTQTKQTVPVRLDVEFTDEDIDLQIMGSGFPMYSWWWEIDSVPGGYGIQAEDPNYKGDGIKTMSKVVTFDDIRRVMGEICAGGFIESYSSPALARQQIMDGILVGDFDIDASGADEIMQCAVFGKVVYS